MTRIIIRTIDGMYVDAIVERAEDGPVEIEHHEQHFCLDSGKRCPYCSEADYDGLPEPA